jgi:hypothetical protein
LEFNAGTCTSPVVGYDLYQAVSVPKTVSLSASKKVPVLGLSLDLISNPDETKPWFMKIRGYSPNGHFNSFHLIFFYGIPPFLTTVNGVY